MKFIKEIPSCRTLHASTSIGENVFIYGGVDKQTKDADVNNVWMLQPL